MAGRSKRSAKAVFDLGQVQGLQDALKGVALDVQASVIGDMVKEAARPIVRSIKSKVRVRYGNLKKSITAVVRKKKRTGTALAVIGPESGGRFRGGMKIKKGGDATGSDQPSRYAHLVEFGHAGRNGGASVKAFPFMRPGTDEAQHNAAAAMVVGFQKGMNRALARHSKKLAKS